MTKKKRVKARLLHRDGKRKKEIYEREVSTKRERLFRLSERRFESLGKLLLFVYRVVYITLL